MKLLCKLQVYLINYKYIFFITSAPFQLTGYGKFHYWLLLACGWANAADAVEIMYVFGPFLVSMFAELSIKLII